MTNKNDKAEIDQENTTISREGRAVGEKIAIEAIRTNPEIPLCQKTVKDSKTKGKVGPLINKQG